GTTASASEVRAAPGGLKMDRPDRPSPGSSLRMLDQGLTRPSIERRARVRSSPVGRRLARWAPGYLFIAPALVLTALLVIFPLAESFWASFHSFSLISRSAPAFLGLQNYVETLQDPHFLTTLQ